MSWGFFLDLDGKVEEGYSLDIAFPPVEQQMQAPRTVNPKHKYSKADPRPDILYEPSGRLLSFTAEKPAAEPLNLGSKPKVVDTCGMSLDVDTCSHLDIFNNTFSGPGARGRVPSG